MFFRGTNLKKHTKYETLNGIVETGLFVKCRDFEFLFKKEIILGYFKFMAKITDWLLFLIHYIITINLFGLLIFFIKFFLSIFAYFRYNPVFINIRSDENVFFCFVLTCIQWLCVCNVYCC